MFTSHYTHTLGLYRQLPAYAAAYTLSSTFLPVLGLRRCWVYSGAAKAATAELQPLNHAWCHRRFVRLYFSPSIHQSIIKPGLGCGGSTLSKLPSAWRLSSSLCLFTVSRVSSRPPPAGACLVRSMPAEPLSLSSDLVTETPALMPDVFFLETSLETIRCFFFFWKIRTSPFS